MEFSFPISRIREGLAEVIVPNLEKFRKDVWDYAPSKAPVFFNPAMKLNRDLAVLVLQAYQRTVNGELTVSEPLAGCGVRGIRFAKEVEGVCEVRLNDINPEAYRMAQHNVELNAVGKVIRLFNMDANLFLSQHDAPHKRFNYIDLDPFGTPVPYLDSAIRALRSGGLLALTATDLAPLCGVYPKVALRKYGGLALRTEYSHEIALRLLSGCLASAAARHDIGVNIMFSHKNGHYVRVYALLNQGAKKASLSLQKMGFIMHCFRCFHRETVTGIFPPVKVLCDECGSPLKIAGPLWLGKMVDKDFCELVENEASKKRTGGEDRIMKTLALVKAESDAPPTFYVVDHISDKLNITIPPISKVIKILEKEGFKTYRTHFNTRGLKTDAPAKTVLEAVKEALKN
jgi:tRNA (guanine26-N2/guanine27-N2)-dimethyltransferase